MEKIKCITFDKNAQDSLPQHIKDKMKADREKAQSEKYFTCKGCNHELPIKFQMRTVGYCYMCDPNVEVSELL